ncbi:MAG: hypothetical protein V1721_09720 [Pseudomonadota bacterium]
MAKAFGQGLAMEGNVEVTPKDAFYEVRLPGLSFVLGSEGKLDIGTITAKATPDSSGGWLTDVTLPSPMTFYDKTNTPVSEITIGAQSFSGIWNPSKEIYSKFDSSYQDIRIKSPDLLTVSIGSLKSRIDLKDNDDGTWSGPNDYEAADIKIEISARNALRLDIGRIISSNTYKRLNLNQTLEVKKKLREVFNPEKPMTEEDRKALLETLLSKSQKLIDDMSSVAEIVGFSLTENNTDPAQPRREISFDKFTFQGVSDGLGKEKSAFNIKSSLDGLKTSFIPAGFEGLAPKAFNIDVAIADLPFRKILETLVTAGAEAADKQKQKAENGDKTEPAKADAAAFLPKMLQDAGSSLAFQNTFVKSADLNIGVTGKIEASATTPTGAVGTVTLSLKGLDETVRKLQTLAVKPGADPRIMGYTGALALFQMMGQSDTAADGATLRNYVFLLTPDGKLLLNNVDFNALAASTMRSQRTKEVPTATPKKAPPAP